MKCKQPGCSMCDETSEEYLARKGWDEDVHRGEVMQTHERNAWVWLAARLSELVRRLWRRL